MRTTVIDQTGVELAGPDTPGLAAAEAREGNVVEVKDESESTAYLNYVDRCREAGRQALCFEDWAQRGRKPGTGPVHDHIASAPVLGASAGAVSRDQAGILPTRGLQVTPEMIIAAQNEGMRHENPLGASAVRAMLEASLTARSRV
ncbi:MULTISPECIES: hypothetical protein [unclassified Methylobacterium]|uniref:hypothetical protein n=1 Tax=unclassified Methylobacterium TaxID=2615210 RepID=UPI0011C1DA16|nr:MULTISPECIES: hypothetical protein [unclassified Methylobacterium]QEE37910.1 hypothetical protein FVA80_01995 [Methylobacterium sp. WL1]TXN59384.1 hypothetical protein FV241_02415 [Methylobacterium sp. WL2]